MRRIHWPGNPTRRARVVLSAALLLMSGVGALGCGGSKSSSSNVVIYSSFPLQGASRAQALAMNNGAKLALREAGGRAGRFNVQFKTLDDSVAQTGAWDPAQTSANARRALQDSRAVAYLGEYNSGATALSLPLTNQGGIPQITVSSSVGLTQGGPGTTAGEPQKYYPTGKRTLIRVSVTDNEQGKLLAQLPQAEGCSNIAVIDDQELFGKGLASVVVSSAQSVGLPVVVQSSIDKQAANFRGVASRLASKRASCFVFTGCTANGATQLFKDVAQALPAAKLFGSDCVLTEDFYDPAKGGIPASVARRVEITAQVLPADQYGPKGKKVFKDFSKSYGIAKPDGYAVYGFQMMDLALTGLKQASSTTSEKATTPQVRGATLKALFGLKDFPGVLGTFSVEPSGDLTLPDFALYKITAGTAVFERKASVKK